LRSSSPSLESRCGRTATAVSRIDLDDPSRCGLRPYIDPIRPPRQWLAAFLAAGLALLLHSSSPAAHMSPLDSPAQPWQSIIPAPVVFAGSFTICAGDRHDVRFVLASWAVRFPLLQVAEARAQRINVCDAHANCRRVTRTGRAESTQVLRSGRAKLTRALNYLACRLAFRCGPAARPLFSRSCWQNRASPAIANVKMRKVMSLFRWPGEHVVEFSSRRRHRRRRTAMQADLRYARSCSRDRFVAAGRVDATACVNLRQRDFVDRRLCDLNSP